MAITLVVGALGVVFDTTIISVALNDLTQDLDAPLSTIQWVGTGYMLAVFLTIPLAGWAQSRIGGRRLWITALGGFLVCSSLSALAWNAGSLIVFRLGQGLAGGIMMPLMYTLLMQAAKGRDIGKVMAVITVPTALGPVLGPVLGGLILHLADWRWLFVVNIPFCLLRIRLARRELPDDRPAPGRPRARLDVVGLLLLSPGSAALLYGLSRVDGTTGFADVRVLVPLLAGLALIGGFTVRALTRDTGALVDVRMFRHRSVAGSSTLLFLGGISLFGSMMLLPLYFQSVRGATPLGAGLLLIPQGVGALAARGLAGRYMDRVGPRAVALVAFAFVAVSTVPFAFVTADTSELLLMAALFVRGVALGAAMIAPMGAAFVGLAHEEIPDAGMITRVAQQIGGAVGVAVLLVVLQRNIGAAHTPSALATGFGHAFWWAAALTACAVPLCLLLPGLPEPAAPADDTAENSENTGATAR
ncbi:DHA2 family efflux MFS transporter permease subunit [Streptomyces tagetis]|uniref:DHA2 family efflux MFS transporter permease subunit n=1 Tax=Streptomyces tagetis TaxID=2820809 RepID=A0A940XGD7_9ACTN|nr:DHA2 family efflux MFS transporter permease subunit [Streptomyces sp. RG38]MBQ0826652.1 DHA2 family efflux MFS transporter permease subunit [Streptomyces sp. RG38]